MIIDFHVHLFPETVCVDRQCHFEGEPEFELLYGRPAARLVSEAELLAAMDEQGVDRAVVFGFPWRNPERFRRHNDCILEAVARKPGRLIGFGCFDPASPEAAREAERCLDAGLSGIGELAFYGSGLDAEALARLAPVMELCRARGRPVLLHTNEPIGHAYPGKTPLTLAQIYGLAGRFPQNEIVLAHWGGGLFFYGLLKKEVRERFRNLHFDTAASPFLYEPAVYRIAVQTAGVERILFGSDFPLIPPARYFREMEACGLSPAERDLICGGNAARLLGLRDIPGREP
ncbi:MAG: amidohydrolase family protein [Desulfobacterales bacterium]